MVPSISSSARGDKPICHTVWSFVQKGNTIDLNIGYEFIFINVLCFFRNDQKFSQIQRKWRSTWQIHHIPVPEKRK